MKADRKKNKGWIRQQNRASRPATMGIALIGMFNVLTGMVQGWNLAVILANLLEGQDIPNATPLWWFIFASLIRVALGAIQEVLALNSGIKARRRLRRETLDRILEQGPALLRHHHSAAIAALLVDKIEMLEGYFSRWLPASLLWMVAQWSVVAVVFWKNHSAGLILALCCLSLPIFQIVFGIATAMASRKQLVAMSRLQVRFLDRIRGIATIVLSGNAERDASALGQAAEELRKRTMKVLRLAFFTSATTDIAMIVALVWIVISQSHTLLHGSGAHTHSAVLALFSVLMVPEAFAPFRALSAVYQDRAHIGTSAEAMHTLPQVPSHTSLEHHTSAVTPVQTERGITLDVRHITYHWDKERAPALRDMSFYLDAGHVALIEGPSGAGKSTLIEALLGFIRPEQGDILLGGASLKEASPRSITQHVSWIGQKPVIFAGSLRSNILFARPDASEEELIAALKASSVWDYIHELPHGLETPLGEGGFGLSGGQAQRVAIARAFLKNAPLLIMDEPTAHLDPDTEADILNALKKLLVGRTSVISTHSPQFRNIGETHRLRIEKGQIVAHEVLS